jgi:transcriptional regulator
MSNDKEARDHAMTQREVGEAMDLDRGMISYLEKKALANFAKELAKRGYKMEDFIGEKNDTQL